MKKSRLLGAVCACLSVVTINANAAVPVLQLGPSSFNDAEYNTSTGTWDIDSDGSGGYSFNAYNLGDNGLTAYLAFSSVPESTTDNFTIHVSDVGGISLSLYSQGYGTPPFQDPNSLPQHGIYDTWSEIYEIVFDGPQSTIFNTLPSESGSSALGYSETIFVDYLSSDPSLNAIHIDLFTADYGATNASNIVTGFAPTSHDAELIVSAVPIPAAVWLFGSGLLGLVGVARRKA